MPGPVINTLALNRLPLKISMVRIQEKTLVNLCGGRCNPLYIKTVSSIYANFEQILLVKAHLLRTKTIFNALITESNCPYFINKKYYHLQKLKYKTVRKSQVPLHLT